MIKSRSGGVHYLICKYTVICSIHPCCSKDNNKFFVRNVIMKLCYLTLFVVVACIILMQTISAKWSSTCFAHPINKGIVIPEFDGEFGHELDRAIPYAYKMFKDGKVKTIKYMKGVEILYRSIFPIEILQPVQNYKRNMGNGKSGWGKLIGVDNHRKTTSFPWEAPKWTGKFNQTHLYIQGQYAIRKLYCRDYTSDTNRERLRD